MRRETEDPIRDGIREALKAANLRVEERDIRTLATYVESSLNPEMTDTPDITGMDPDAVRVAEEFVTKGRQEEARHRTTKKRR